MAKLTIQITRQDIYHIAEGVSVTISQHNAGVPTYEQLWASPDESRKLDIYYREAISDLEKKLHEWIDNSSSQFDLTTDSGNYSLVLNMNRYWPTRLEGLLKNKVQDYIVHAVTAGWLNDFDGLNVKLDYQTIAIQDLTDIRDIVCQRAFNFDTTERSEETDAKPTPDGITPDARKEETNAKPTPDNITPDARKSETDAKHTPDALTPDARKSETDAKHTPDTLTPDARKSDTVRYTPGLESPAGFRRKDTVVKVNNDDIPPYCKPKHLRHRDNDIVEHHDDWTDWSGTGIAFRDRMLPHHDPDFPKLPPLPPVAPLPQAGYGVSTSSPRVHRNMGYTPSRVPPRPCPAPPPCPPAGRVPCGSPARKDPRIPDDPTHPNYPPIKSDGVGWTDMPLYDEAGSERAMVHHCPKPGCDGRDPDLKWDINDNN